MTRDIIAVIPARGASKSIPKKNIMDFFGKPLIAWTIEQAQSSRHVADVYVTTDDDEISGVSERHGAKIIRRPAALASDVSSSEEALLHALNEIEKKRKVSVVVFLQATSPVRDAGDIDNALEKFFAEEADSLFSAAVLEDFCVWEIKQNALKSLTFDYKNRGRRQDREPYYLENGSIYIFKPDILRQCNNRFGGKIIYYPMPLWKSYEIDSAEDVEICGYYMRNKILTGQKHVHAPADVDLIVYDFDGVLTDNKAIVKEDGTESVTVNRSDGLFIGMLKKMNIKQVILTTEVNKVVEARARKLGIPALTGLQDKRETLLSYCKTNNVPLEKVMFIGNDVNDLDAMTAAGFAVCPSDAADEIKKISGIVLQTKGGQGVVRELINYIKREGSHGE